jgi:uncharacterized membrane protein YdjX (TVP38/TMEM64 family)
MANSLSEREAGIGERPIRKTRHRERKRNADFDFIPNSTSPSRASAECEADSRSGTGFGRNLMARQLLLEERVGRMTNYKVNRWMRFVVVGMMLLSAVLLLKVGPATGGVEHFRQRLLSYGPWAVLISALLMVAQSTILPLPGNVVAVTNGLVFGPLYGALLSWVTTLVGASICFLLSRRLGKPFAHRIVGGSLDRAESFFKKYGLHTMFAVRIVPFMPFDAISYVAGLVGVSYPMFLLATAVGIIPSILIYSYLGSIVVSPYWYIVICLATAAIAGIIIGILALRKTRTSSPFAGDRICDNV